MPQVILDPAGVDALGSEVMAAGVAQHVGVDAATRQRTITDALDHPAEARCTPGPAAFGEEDEPAARRLEALDLAQGADHIAIEVVGRADPALDPAHQEAAGGEVEVGPLDRHKFGCPEPVAVGHPDGKVIAQAVPGALRLGLDRLQLHLAEVLVAPLPGLCSFRWMGCPGAWGLKSCCHWAARVQLFRVYLLSEQFSAWGGLT